MTLLKFVESNSMNIDVIRFPQTVSWLGAECSLLDDCLLTISEPKDLKNLLQHHKNLGHLDRHGRSLLLKGRVGYL